MPGLSFSGDELGGSEFIPSRGNKLFDPRFACLEDLFVKDKPSARSEKTPGRWLADPDTMVPGNDMEFDVPKETGRRDLIAFLKQSNEPGSKVNYGHNRYHHELNILICNVLTTFRQYAHQPTPSPKT